MSAVCGRPFIGAIFFDRLDAIRAVAGGIPEEAGRRAVDCSVAITGN